MRRGWSMATHCLSAAAEYRFHYRRRATCGGAYMEYRRIDDCDVWQSTRRVAGSVRPRLKYRLYGFLAATITIRGKGGGR